MSELDIDDDEKLISDIENGFELHQIPIPPKSTYEGRVRSGDTERLGVLTTQIQGHRYQTKAYYQQYLGKDDTTDDFKPSSSISVDQYIKIKDVLLILDSQMPSYSVDAEKGTITYSGTATTPCHFLPNKGDLFIATVDTGRDYMFEVSSKPERKTVFEQAAYTFEFKSLYDVRDTPHRLKALEDRVVLRKVYVPELTTYSEKSILLENEYDLYVRLSKHRYYLADTYQTSFLSHDVNSLVVPSQFRLAYDSDAVKAFLAIANLHAYGSNMEIEELNCKDEIVKSYKTIWHLLKEAYGDPRRLAVKKFGLISSKKFTARAWFRSVRYSGISEVYCPRGCLDNQKLYGNNSVYQGGKLSPSTITIDGMDILIKNSEYGSKLPHIVPVTIDDFYIFSQSFYLENRPISTLEYIVLEMLGGRRIQPEMLVELCDSAIDWGDLEYYYYVPVLLYLIEWAFKNGF
jgi:hypothetical protein